jgi:hypothetical protein
MTSKLMAALLTNDEIERVKSSIVADRRGDPAVARHWREDVTVYVVENPKVHASAFVEANVEHGWKLAEVEDLGDGWVRNIYTQPFPKCCEPVRYEKSSDGPKLVECRCGWRADSGTEHDTVLTDA